MNAYQLQDPMLPAEVVGLIQTSNCPTANPVTEQLLFLSEEMLLKVQA